MADKDGTGTLTKEECRRLLTDSLNANVPESVFEKLFTVKKI
jgi:Ca2+-binding EF-hand superfamily protein